MNPITGRWMPRTTSPSRPARGRVRGAAGALGIALIATLMSTPAPIASALPPATAQVPWVPNGTVRAVTDDGNGGQFLGGDFTALTLAAHSLAVVDTTGGNGFEAVDPMFPTTDGTVSAVVADGSGGWFIGGDFDAVGTPRVASPHLTHINADGSVDESFTPYVDAPVRALALADGVLYAGGEFSAPGVAVVALDAQFGSIIANFGLTGGTVNTLAVIPSGQPVEGAVVYAGGAFSDGQADRWVTRFVGDIDTNSLAIDLGWQQPVLNEAVRALSVDAVNGVLYAGGVFTQVNADSRFPYLAALDATTGALDTTWIPAPNDAVNALDLDATGVLYAGGAFTSVDNGSATRNHLASFDTTSSGTATGWDPDANGDVLALDLANGQVFVGGAFGSFGGGGDLRPRLAAVDASTGAVGPLTLDPDADVSAINADANGHVAFGGAFTSIATVTRNRAAQIDATGHLTAWNPNVTGGSVRAIVRAGGGVLLGGAFTSVGGANDTAYFASVESTSGAATSSGITFDSVVNAFYISPFATNSVFVGGDFNTLNGTTQRSKLARLTYGAGTWSVDSWSADLTGGQVFALTGDYSRQLYVGGSFTGCSGGGCGAAAAAFHVNTGVVSESWQPDPDGTVYALAWNGYSRQVYLGGAFTSLAGNTNRRYAGAVADVASWSPTALTNLRAWNPRPDGTVYALAFPGAPSGGGNVLMGGAFSTIANSYPRAGLAAVTAEGLGTARSWNPLTTGQSGEVRAIYWPGGSTPAVGGAFTAASQPGSNFAILVYEATDRGPFTFENTDFGVVASGSRQLTVYAYNRSGNAISNSIIVGVNNIATAAGVSYRGDSCSQSYAPIMNGAICTITLEWAPQTAVIPANALVQITINGDPAAAAPSAAELTGTTYPPGPLTFSNTADFGDVPVGTTATRTITVTNTGLSAAIPSAITPAGDGVTIGGGTCATSRAIAASDTCTVELAWAPTSPGALSAASLTIAYPDGTNASDTVALTGTARRPGALTFSSGAFASTTVGASTSLTVTVRNTGNATATPSAIAITGTGVSRTGGTCAVSAAIAADNTCTVLLHWTPSAAGTLADGSLTITYPNGATAANALTLTGTASSPSSGGGGGGSSPDASSTPTVSKPVSSPTPSAATGSATPSMTTDNRVFTPVAGPVRRLSGPAVATTPILQTVRPASRRLSVAPIVATTRGATIRVALSGLRRSTPVAVSVGIGRTWYRLGIVTTDSQGRATTPAFMSEATGTFPLRISRTGDAARYAKVRIG